MHTLIAFVPVILLILIFGSAVYFGLSQHPEPHKPLYQRPMSPMSRSQRRAARNRGRKRLFQKFLLNKLRDQETKEGK
jgi:hypothetical protein